MIIMLKNEQPLPDKITLRKLNMQDLHAVCKQTNKQTTQLVMQSKPFYHTQTTYNISLSTSHRVQ